MVHVHRHITQGELMHGNQGICSHASPECCSLMPLLRQCLTLETLGTCDSTAGSEMLAQRHFDAEQMTSDLGSKILKLTSSCVNQEVGLGLLSLSFIIDLVFIWPWKRHLLGIVLFQFADGNRPTYLVGMVQGCPSLVPASCCEILWRKVQYRKNSQRQIG